MRYTFIAFLILASKAFSECPNPPAGLADNEEPTFQKIAIFNDWSLFSITEKKECWIASSPSTTHVQANSGSDELCRGIHQISVTIAPRNKFLPEFSFAAGFQIVDELVPVLKWNSEEIPLPVVSEGHAWSQNSKTDNEIIKLFMRSKSFNLISYSSSGHRVTDTFHLSGFSSALTAAFAECGIEIMS